jgi:hypothetical protein
MKHSVFAGLFLGSLIASQAALAQQAFFVKPLVEMKVKELPPGDLYWHLSNFDSKEKAQASVGRYGMVAEKDGKIWLFSLGPATDIPPGGATVAKIGPIPRIDAAEYLLRVNEAGGPPASVTSVHTHPGSEAFYVVAGELTQKTPHGTARVAAGSSMVGHGGDTPMEVSSTGQVDLKEFALFVVDAARPFSSPAKLP